MEGGSTLSVGERESEMCGAGGWIKSLGGGGGGGSTRMCGAGGVGGGGGVKKPGGEGEGRETRFRSPNKHARVWRWMEGSATA